MEKTLLYDIYDCDALLHALQKLNCIYQFKTITFAKTDSNKIISEQLMLPIASNVVFWERILFIDNQPEMVLRSYFNGENSIIRTKSISMTTDNYQQINKLIPVSHCEEEILIAKVSQDDCEMLEIPDHKEIVMIKGNTFDDNEEAVEYYEYTVLSDVIQFIRESHYSEYNNKLSVKASESVNL